jgi:predicted unusual protein kinase regulating ubiquinone biosynthesis (AarF/ABC1/UbiB family)
MAGSMASQELVRRVRQTQSTEDSLINLSQARILVSELGHLKGAAMKLGQMLALEARDYFPEEICIVLDQLQSNVSYLEFNAVDQILMSELGERYRELTEVSARPIAAASIGQVHSARLPGGEQVAVKVQYPHIFESIQSDVKVLSGVLKAVSIMMRKEVDLNALIQEFSEIFVQESDYFKEASFTETYGQKARLVSGLDVPCVHKKYSTQRVLTLDLKEGLKFSEWIKTPEANADTRKFYGELILDLYTREFCEWGLVQTDPNLGNFLFVPNERKLVLLDFGATKSYSIQFRKNYSQLICSVLEKNYKKMLQISEEMNLIHPKESNEAKEIFKNLLVQSMSPIVVSDHYDFSKTDYPEAMRKLSRELVKALRYSPPPKDLIFLHRKLSGIFYILRQLKIQLSLRRYTERFEKLAAQE